VSKTELFVKTGIINNVLYITIIRKEYCTFYILPSILFRAIILTITIINKYSLLCK